MNAPANVHPLPVTYTRLTERALSSITTLSAGDTTQTARLMVRASAMVARSFMPTPDLVKQLRDLATEIERVGE